MSTRYNFGQLTLCVALMILSSPAIAQSSFQKRLNIDLSFATHIVQMQDSAYILAVQAFPNVWILCVDKSGVPLWGLQLNHVSSQVQIVDLGIDLDDNILFSIYYSPFQSNTDLIKIDPNGNFLWRVPIHNYSHNVVDFKTLCISADGHCLSCLPQPGHVTQVCTMVNPNGDLLWAKSFYTGEISTISSTYALADGNFMIAQTTNSSKTALNTIDPSGQLIGSFTIPLNRITFLETHDNDLILLEGFNSQRLMLSRVTRQGQVIWSKFIANIGSINAYRLTKQGDDFLISFFPHKGLGQYIQIDAQGQLVTSLTDNVYSGGEFEIGGTTVTSDQGIATVRTRLLPNLQSETIITKWSDSYELEDCNVISNCHNIQDTIINAGPGVNVQITDVTIQQTGDIIITPYSFSTEDYCVPFEYPNPFFEIPDTICVGTCISPAQLAQTYADTWSWTSTGFLPDTSSMQDPGVFCAEQVGTFLLSQVISLAGCVDSFSRTITVMSPPVLNMIIDSVICPFKEIAIPMPSDATYRELTLPDGSIQYITTDTLYLGPLDQDACFTLRLGNQQLCDTIIDFCIVVQSPLATVDTIYRCVGEFAVIHNDTIYSSGIYTSVIKDMFSCDSTSTLILVHTTSPQVDVLVEMPTCEVTSDGTIALNGTPGLMYLWNDGNTDGIRSDLSAGTWQVTVSSGSNCDTIIPFTLVSSMPFTLELPSQIQLPPGGLSKLQPIVHPPGNYTYSWSPDTGLNCVDCPSPLASPLGSTTYTLMVTDELGCIQSEDVLIIIIGLDEIASALFFPTVFSPNGDGINDKWQVLSGHEVRIASLGIFDRWGGQVFACQNVQSPFCVWDGKWRGQLVMEGTYVWHAKIEVGGYGTIERKGEVNVIR